MANSILSISISALIVIRLILTASATVFLNYQRVEMEEFFDIFRSLIELNSREIDPNYEVDQMVKSTLIVLTITLFDLISAVNVVVGFRFRKVSGVIALLS